MPRKKLEDEEAEIGRVMGSLERAGYKEIIDEVKAQAKAEGKNPADKFAEVVRIGLSYDKYKRLSLADAMLVMDWMERVFNNFIFPVMQQTGDFSLYSAVEKISALAESMGYVHKETIQEAMKKQIEEAYQKGREDAIKEMQEKQSEGPVTKFVKTLAETIANRLGEKTIERLAESGMLDEVIDKLVNVATASAESLEHEG